MDVAEAGPNLQYSHWVVIMLETSKKVYQTSSLMPKVSHFQQFRSSLAITLISSYRQRKKRKIRNNSKNKNNIRMSAAARQKTIFLINCCNPKMVIKISSNLHTMKKIYRQMSKMILCKSTKTIVIRRRQKRS